MLGPGPRSPLCALALVLACNNSETTGESTTETSSTSTSATTTTDTPTTSTSEPTSSTGAPTSGPATTSSTGEPSTSSTTSSTGDTTSTSGSTVTTDTTTGGGSGLVLDPASLVFFELPINSIRYAVAGFDPAQQTCVAVIFFGDIETEQCDTFKTGDDFGFPYVVVTPNATSPCMDWDYTGNVTLDSASGCVQLTASNPLQIAIDMAMTVSGPPFTGAITVASP